MVIDHAPQAFEMGQGRPDHTRHCSNRLDDYHAVVVALPEQQVSKEAQRLGEAEREAIPNIDGVMMSWSTSCVVRHDELHPGINTAGPIGSAH
jgi:hypothetical protein